MRIETPRLILREWRNEDKAPYAKIIGDPHVRRFYPGVGSYADADAGIERAKKRLANHGFSFMAVERKADGVFMGMLGMAPLTDDLLAVMRSNPGVEIGWQLGKEFWGQGYAPEGARAMLDLAWQLHLAEIVAFTTVTNLPSQRVMEKLGMRYDPTADFMHPAIPEGHPLRPHVLYRIARPIAA
jgi:RimJ/RimL family protein N-acetyltransferase